jgi:8-oxo-dGTP pyrophosphatase MutT (NUDIX family)
MPKVVTCLLTDDEGKLLILKRSDKVRTYKGLWGGVAGYVEKNEKPLETAFKEIKEEVSLDENDVTLIEEFKPFEITDFYEDNRYDWNIFVFLFKCLKKEKIQIDWEHTRYEWIPPSKIHEYDTAPHLKETVSKILL